MRSWVAGGIALLAVASAVPTAAETFPNRPLRLVVPYAPGGVLDYTGRQLAKALGDRVGQQVVVDNRPGAGGVIGTDLVAHSPPDGYTMVIMDLAIAVNPSLQKQIPFDVMKDLQPISMVNTSPLVVAVNVAAPATDIKSLVAYAKTKAGGLTYGSAGVGTGPHMAGELFRLQTGAPLIHVAYKGIGPATSDLVAGQIDLVFGSLTGTVPFINDGKLRGLATTGAKRPGAMPDVPTVAEQGVTGFDVALWLMLFGPAGLPQPLLERLNQEVHGALATPSLVEAFAKVGADPLPTSPEQSTAFLTVEIDKWARVVRDANIKPE
jgi:tripartite-type tricarboxylate transporter receptor subunit TctC